MSSPQWPLWADEHPAPEHRCEQCGAAVPAFAAFCEACGAPLNPSAPAPAAQPAETSTQTRRLGSRASTVEVCRACSGTVAADGYCQTCGAKAPDARDHFSQSPAPWVGGICDRGVQHHRNEDALALWAEADQAVLVVCDGVSTSVDSDVAAMAGAEAAREHLVAHRAEADQAAVLVAAAAAANTAVVAATAPASPNAASATFAAAVVGGGRVHYANLGDSRVYFLGATEQLLLSVDDSVAQAFIDEGMPRAEAEAMSSAHAITKWLGRDSDDITPRTGVHQVDETGWLLVCSDGLWNYASAPEDLAAVIADAPDSDPVELARYLVEWANGCGGRDNITVALARLDPLTTLATPQPEKEQPSHG